MKFYGETPNFLKPPKCMQVMNNLMVTKWP